jgi:hypothetical protein
MSDRVEKFLEEFELALDAAGRESATESTVKAALRRSQQLSELLEERVSEGKGSRDYPDLFARDAPIAARSSSVGGGVVPSIGT